VLARQITRTNEDVLRLSPHNWLAVILGPAVIAVAGCGGHVSASGANIAQQPEILIHATTTQLDTNRTTRLTATLADGEPVSVDWLVSGGDPNAGAGTISKDGIYTPPSYLTRDAVRVEVSAVLAGKVGPAASDSAALTITPGFLQPLTPGNLSLGAGGSVMISGSLTEVGGNGGIHFSVASDASGTPSGAGSLSDSHCVRGSVSGSNPSYTMCSVTYTAPATVPATGSVFIVGSVTGNSIKSWTRVLLNSAGITSNPTAHQERLVVPVQLGSSSGSNTDYDANLGQLTDCCGGTLGALLQDTVGNQYVLSNNHVFARSDQSIPGETIIQPGLIDNGCTPYGVGPGTTPVATLISYPALASAATNVDAAIARVTPGMVDPRGNILELGAKQPDGTLAAAPIGISSTGGKGELASLGMWVAKSGRTTGLTCAAVSAVNVDVVVDYFTDCAETTHALTKTFRNQIAISGTSFSDAGDSGALVVDSSNAEPVGLFFAGGTDNYGVEHAIASPIGDVLSALAAQVPAANGQTDLSLVGGQDHPVSCLSYESFHALDDGTTQAAEFLKLAEPEREHVEAALPQAQSLIDEAAGILRVGFAASKDRPGEGAIAVYLEPTVSAQTLASIPASVNGIPTIVVMNSPASGLSVSTSLQPRATSENQVLALKQRSAAILFKSNPAVFGVGVGASLDNPMDAALVLMVDRDKFKGLSAESMQALAGQRIRVLRMDRLHVTRAHGTPVHNTGCMSSHDELTGEGYPIPETPLRLNSGDLRLPN
jgi:hypothetical protein